MPAAERYYPSRLQTPVEIPPGAFDYSAYDSTGNLLVFGWLTLDIADSGNVTGEWHFTKTLSAANVGPRVGDGELIGEFVQDLLLIDLNPGWVDNNVFLSGALDENSFEGTWALSTAAGVWNRGSFKAVIQV